MSTQSFCRGAAFASVALFTCVGLATPPSRPLDEAIGAIHSGGRYRVPSLVPTLPRSQWPANNATEVVQPGDPDASRKLSYFEEGAYVAKTHVGTKVLKLFANSGVRKGYAGFTPYNPWRTKVSLPEELAYTSLTDMLDEAPYKNVLDDASFKIVLMNATNLTAFWRDAFVEDGAPYPAIHGIDFSPDPLQWDQWIRQVYYETKDLTTYLLTQYGAQGRTFILQNWEGDNDINADATVPIDPNDPCGPKTYRYDDVERQRRVDLFTEWIKVRQKAVEDARAAYFSAHPTATSKVYCAVEFNLNPGTFNPALARTPAEILQLTWSGLNKVVPFVAVDLYSWSNWSAAKTLGNEGLIVSGLDYYRSRLPASNSYSPELAGNRIFIGEFGCYELKTQGGALPAYTPASDADYSTIVERQREYALKWGARYCLQWVLFDNGVRSEPCGGTPNNYDFSDFDYPMAHVSNSYVGENGLFQNALTGVWMIRGAKDASDPKDHSFPYAFGATANWLHRREYYDELTTKTNFTATNTNDFLVATTTAAWNGHDGGRLYLAASPTDPAIVYSVPEDLRDFGVRAYLYSSNPDSPIAVSARFGYQVSSVANNWANVPVEDFSILQQDWLDKNASVTGWNQKNWKEFLLGPSAAGIPSGTRYVRIVFRSASSGSNAQLGSVRLYTALNTLSTDELAVDINSATSGHRCEQPVPGTWNWTAATSTNTEGNVGRIWSVNTSAAAELVYRVENLTSFSLRIYHTGTGDTATTIPSHVKAWISPTGLTADRVAVTLVADAPNSRAVTGAPGWFSTKIKPSGLAIEGAKYLIIGFDPTTRAATDTQLGVVALVEDKAP